MKNMDRSTQVSFGNFILRKYGINDQVTAELIQEFYDKPAEQIEELETFVFPDDLDKIVPTTPPVIHPAADADGGKKKDNHPAPGSKRNKPIDNPE